MDFNVPDGIIAPRLSGDIGELIAFGSLRGGSRVTGGLSARGLAKFQLEIGPTISRLLWAITAIDVHHLLRNSCHLGFQNFVGLMRRSRS
jgi:hypothetical protein